MRQGATALDDFPKATGQVVLQDFVEKGLNPIFGSGVVHVSGHEVCEVKAMATAYCHDVHVG
jgi:hypothetical protein